VKISEELKYCLTWSTIEASIKIRVMIGTGRITRVKLSIAALKIPDYWLSICIKNI